MERQSKFDQEIKGKMGVYSAEPSARVWAGIRGEIGMASPQRKRMGIVYSLAAAASVAILIGLGFFANMRQSGPGKTEATAVRNRTEKQPDSVEKNVHLYTDSPEVIPEEHAEPVLRYEPPKEIKKEPTAIVEEPAIREVPEKISPKSVTMNIEGPEKNDMRFLEYFTSHQMNEAIANTPDPEETKDNPSSLPKLDDIRQNPGAILGALSNGANKVLGLDTEYKTQQEDDFTTTAFSANFGLFKVKRVKKIKE